MAPLRYNEWNYRNASGDIGRLMHTLRLRPGVSEISIEFAMDYRKVPATIKEAEAKGLIRKVRCLNPAYHSYFAIRVTT